MVRYYTLSAEDRALIDRRRGEANRLGFAIMLCYCRYPGRPLLEGERPPPEMLAFVADQLNLDPACFSDYAGRDQTRRKHLAEIQTAVGFRGFDRSRYREIAAWLLPTALATERGVTLASVVIEELRARRILMPPIAVIERLCGEVRYRAQRQLWRALTEGLNEQQSAALDGFLKSAPPAARAAWHGSGKPHTRRGRGIFRSSSSGCGLSPRSALDRSAPRSSIRIVG